MKFDGLNRGAQQIFNGGETIINVAPGATANVYQEASPLLGSALTSNLLSRWGVGGERRNDPTIDSMRHALRRLEKKIRNAEARLEHPPARRLPNSRAQIAAPQPSASSKSQGLKENGSEIDTGRYKINYGRDTVTITDKETNTSVKAWGDPHFDTSDGDRADFHKKPLTIDLQDGAKVTIAPTAVDGNGVSYVDKVQVIKGKEAVEVSGIHNSDGSSSGVVRGEKARQLDRKQDDGTVLRAGEQIDDLYFTDKNSKIRGEFKGSDVNFDNEETGKSKLGDSGVTKSGAAGQSRAQTSIGDQAINAMKAGGSVKLVMDRDYDNPTYTGDGNGVGDAAGTILLQKDAEYTVSRNAQSGAWTTAGYNEGVGRVVDGSAYPYYENTQDQNSLNMWGRPMKVDPDGSIIDPEYGHVGRIMQINGQNISASTGETGKSKLGDTGRNTDFDRQIQQNLLHDLMARRDSLRKALEARSESTNYDDEDDEDSLTDARSISSPIANRGTTTIDDRGPPRVGAAGGSASQSSIGDQARSVIKNGGDIEVKFDSAEHTATFKPGEVYNVHRSPGGGDWKTTGYNAVYGRNVDLNGQNYFPEDFGPDVLNMWRVGYRVEDDGSVIDPALGKRVGHITKINGQEV